MSKSVGNVVDPFVLISDFGVDQLRYFLLREVPFGQDGNYSREGIAQRINADLANDLGNLAQRSLSMIAKNCGGLVPAPGEFTEADQGDSRRSRRAAPPRHPCDRRFRNSPRARGDLGGGCRHQSLFRRRGALGPQEDEPEAHGDDPLCDGEVMRQIAILVQPAMPGSRRQPARSAGVPQEARSFAALKEPLKSGTELPLQARSSRVMSRRRKTRQRDIEQRRQRRMVNLLPAAEFLDALFVNALDNHTSDHRAGNRGVAE